MESGITGFVKNRKEVEAIPMEGGAAIRWMITHRDGAPNFSMRLITVPAGSNTPFHSHDYEHEIYVIEGSMEVTIGESRKDASRDDFVYIPPNVHHGMKAREDLKIICVVPIKAARQILGE